MSYESEQRVLKRKKMTWKYFKTWSESLAIRELKTKTLKFHLTPVRMAKNKILRARGWEALKPVSSVHDITAAV